MASTPRQRHLREISNTDVAAAVDELAALVEPRFPQRVHRGEGKWPLVAHGLVAQMMSAIRSIVRLEAVGAHSDSLVLLRTLYEQVVTFCWLAIDPTRHLVRWANEAHHENLKLHNDARAFGYSLLSEAQVAEIRKCQGTM